MVSSSAISGPTPLAWKEFRRRSGITLHPKVYTYDASPQIVPSSPTPLMLSPLLVSSVIGGESPRKDTSGYLVAHVTQALQILGASTGGNIADYISSNFTTEQGIPYEKGRKLHYMVNAILSSPKYKYLFLKDQVLKDEKRSLWRLKQPGDLGEDDAQPPPLNLSLASLVPSTVSLSALIPPTSPSLSLHHITSGDGDAEAPSTECITPTAETAPMFPSHLVNYSMVKSDFEERGGGSDESYDDKKPGQPRTTEHPLSISIPSPQSPLSDDGQLPPDTPTSLSSRRKKRKGSGLDLSSSSSSVESMSSKYSDDVPQVVEEKKRRVDSAAA